MAEKKEALFVVSKGDRDRFGDWFTTPLKVFRTRAAARAFVKLKEKHGTPYHYTVARVTWGDGG